MDQKAQDMTITNPFLQDLAMDDKLILVDGLDRQVGTASKQDAHAKGLLHRAFSVLLVRNGARGLEVLLAQRAEHKYHSGGLWANSCCSHPRLGEKTSEAARRRVAEELGCEVVGLREVAAFVYRAEFANGLVEHEYDHVFVGWHSQALMPNPAEVGAVRWIGIDDLAKELYAQPKQFAPWAHVVLSMGIKELQEAKQKGCSPLLGKEEHPHRSS